MSRRDTYTTVELLHVDGINNVLVGLDRRVFEAAGVDPATYGELVKRRGADTLTMKLGAAGARYVGNTLELGEQPREWPPVLPPRLGALLIAALPHAKERIEAMRREGRRAPWVVYSNDIARVQAHDPSYITQRYQASSQSGIEYEALVSAVKQGSDPVEAKADQLGRVVLIAGQRRADSRQRAAPREPRDLSPLAREFLESAEAFADLLGTRSLDWSGPVIGICKAFEYECVTRLIDPLADRLNEQDLSSDLKDRQLRSIAAYCADRSRHPPELGTLGFFLQTARSSRRRATSSPLLRNFLQLVTSWPGATWLLAQDGAIAAVASVTSRFRNRAAHIESLTQEDYLACYDLVVGSSGVLWALIEATSMPSESSAA